MEEQRRQQDGEAFQDEQEWEVTIIQIQEVHYWNLGAGAFLGVTRNMTSLCDGRGTS